MQTVIIARQSSGRLATSRPASTTVSGGRGSLSTGATLGRPPEETGTSAPPSQATPASGQSGAAGGAAALAVGRGAGQGGGGWRARTAGWETAVERQRSPSRPANNGPVQVGVRGIVI